MSANTQVEMTDTQARALDRFYQAAEIAGRKAWAETHASIMERVEAAREADVADGKPFVPKENREHLLPGRIRTRANIHHNRRNR